METILQGQINNLVASCNADIDESGKLVLRKGGKITLTVDTGFSGSFSLPSALLKKLKLKFLDQDTFRLANGEEIELPIFWGEVVLGDHKLPAWFIPGEPLVGMELLSSAGEILLLNFRKKELELKGRKN